MNGVAVESLHVECLLQESIVKNFLEVHSRAKRIEDSKLFETTPAMFFCKRNDLIID